MTPRCCFRSFATVLQLSFHDSRQSRLFTPAPPKTSVLRPSSSRPRRASDKWRCKQANIGTGMLLTQGLLRRTVGKTSLLCLVLCRHMAYRPSFFHGVFTVFTLFSPFVFHVFTRLGSRPLSSYPCRAGAGWRSCCKKNISTSTRKDS